MRDTTGTTPDETTCRARIALGGPPEQDGVCILTTGHSGAHFDGLHRAAQCAKCDDTGLAETPHGGLPLSMFTCSCPTGVEVAKRSDEARHGN